MADKILNSSSRREVPGIPPLEGIKDPVTASVLRALVTGWELRNRADAGGFIARRELKELSVSLTQSHYSPGAVNWSENGWDNNKLAFNKYAADFMGPPANGISFIAAAGAGIAQLIVDGREVAPLSFSTPTKIASTGSSGSAETYSRSDHVHGADNHKFLARHTGGGISSQSGYISFPSEVYDTGGGYNGSNAYTAQAAGYYEFAVLIRPATVNAEYFINLHKNNAEATATGVFYSGSNRTSISYAASLYLNAGDIVKVSSNAAIETGNNTGMFMGKVLI